ncbi:TPA: DNA adenine methylase [Yersinia enterocolitica]|uniref:DNA adenine methylase n=1 Tax=Yersinia TaxID=629 RepID=UPI0005E08A45|nr:MULTISPECIES: DNA adenine methylase [Yersinia]EKN6133544.1 DNA adenine methylase [Yersinia enterocolitica]EKN6194656.1 DNA adenine methylase [Yersinia enterocolitica]CQJ05292.1 D12 class N6 adenine-specific DNA methyltransferase [Yersinia frederiksenii]HDL6525941.1 DNA adenine methylase [Yersinia enterocolitica]HDL6648724.1 DNA adenine methylase [Yersinia enterocolitica]
MAFNTPLRYPGGKGKLCNFMKKIIEVNKLTSLHYAEPYAGGAGLAINLLIQGYAEKVYLNDINRAVFAFWNSVLYETDALCTLIKDTEITIDEWYIQKDISKKSNEQELLTLGFSTFFLNRTNRSGILQGGVIGGKEQSGLWKLNARFNKNDLIKRIEAISELKAKIVLSNSDANIFIDEVVETLPSNSITYLDPPYYIKGQGLYENHYKHDDHVYIAEKIKSNIKTPWIVSYDNVPQIRNMYKECKKITYGINYSAQDRYKGSEIMFFSKKLKVPKVENPAKVK